MYAFGDILPDLRPTWRVRLSAILVVLLIGAMLGVAATADAAKPLKGELSVPDGSYGETVNASVSGMDSDVASATKEATDGPTLRVFAECRQEGEPVYRSYVLVDANGHAALQLGPTPAWQGGSAECTAELGYFDKRTRWRSMDSTTFSVAG